MNKLFNIVVKNNNFDSFGPHMFTWHSQKSLIAMNDVVKNNTEDGPDTISDPFSICLHILSWFCFSSLNLNYCLI